jgi:hypothetical protein
MFKTFLIMLSDLIEFKEMQHINRQLIKRKVR